jgi:threonine/homoserine/homoserine lactone efflux protein
MPNPISFIIILLVSTFTPGPNNILSMSRAAQVGFSRSFRLNLGMFAGFITIQGLITAFNFYLVQVLPVLKPILMVAGAAYILWLAFTIAFSNSNKKAPAQSNAGTFLMGFLLQFVNPKLYIFALTMISTFITPYYSDAPRLAGFVVLMSFTGFIATCAWGMFGSVFKKLFTEHEVVLNRVLAGLLAGSAISLFL